MLTFSIGSFPVPVSQLAVLLAGLVALGVGRLAGQRQPVAEAVAISDADASAPSVKTTENLKTPGIGATLSDMLLAALLVARLVFVLTWLDSYRDAPWTLLDIRDGGFTPWAGVAGEC